MMRFQANHILTDFTTDLFSLFSLIFRELSEASCVRERKRDKHEGICQSVAAFPPIQI